MSQSMPRPMTLGLFCSGLWGVAIDIFVSKIVCAHGGHELEYAVIVAVADSGGFAKVWPLGQCFF